MKIDIKTDTKGLIKLLTFLESDENLVNVNPTRNIDNLIFYLDSVASDIGESAYGPIINYQISIGQKYQTSDLKHKEALFSIIKAIAE